MKIDYERNKKYFKQKISVWFTIIGFVLAAVGLFFVVILANTRGAGRGYMTPGLICILLGAVDLVVINAIKIKDSEIDSILPEAQAEFAEKFKAQFTETNAAKLKFAQTYGSAKKDEPFEPVIFGTFCFEEKNAMHKKGADGKMRSSVYAFSAFALQKDYICIGERKIPLVTTETVLEDGTSKETLTTWESYTKLLYTELEKAELVHVEKFGYAGNTKYRHLRVVKNDGAALIEFPILADAAADEYVAEINQKIMRAKEHAAAAASN